MLMVVLMPMGEAEAANRTLKFYNVHTKERATIVYKTGNKYSAKGLRQVNDILRDWRAKEPTKMDPQLLDLIWTVYRQSGSKDYIHIISGYRSPRTNAMLKRTRGGQATKSQHMLGKALDFYLPDVKLSKLQALGLKMHVGGVGYYPRSGSPFVHLDTGNVRHWPRMSRSQLVKVFPKGDTIHVPSDGKPLAQYKQTLASVKARNRNGVLDAFDGDQPKRKTLLAALFGGGADEEEDEAQPAPSRAPAVESRPAAPAVTATPAAPAEPSPAEQLEAVIASLPNRGPVPPSSPRRVSADAVTPEIIETPVVPEPVAPEPVVPEQPVVEEVAPEEVLVAALSEENVPRPTRRPAYTPVDDTAIAAIAAIVENEAPTPEAVLAALEQKRPSGAEMLRAAFGNGQPESQLEQSTVQSAFRPLDNDLTATLGAVPGLRPSNSFEGDGQQFAALPNTVPAPAGKSARVSSRPLPAAEPAARSGPIGRFVETGVQTTAKTNKLVLANLQDRFEAAGAADRNAILAEKLKQYAEKRLRAAQ